MVNGCWGLGFFFWKVSIEVRRPLWDYVLMDWLPNGIAGLNLGLLLGLLERMLSRRYHALVEVFKVGTLATFRMLANYFCWLLYFVLPW